MTISKIQWCFGTVSPVPTCDGCPLRRPDAVVEREIENSLTRNGFVPKDIAKAVPAYRASLENSRRKRIFAALVTAIPKTARSKDLVTKLTREIYKLTSSCYAGVLTDNRGGKIKGYADRFEDIAMFPGRMERAAKQKSTLGLPCPEKPWLDGSRFLWFVNDMGDALSSPVPFEFLEKEIIDVAESENGRRHVWLWLTKRPQRMAKFFDWLKNKSKEWPSNLVPMTSVLDKQMATQVKHLRDIPAIVRGLSVEPLFEKVELDLTGIHWIIVGGESGPLSRPFDVAWARDLQRQCEKAGAAFFVKQLGSNPIENGLPLKLKDRHGGDWNEWPLDLRVREIPQSFLR